MARNICKTVLYKVSTPLLWRMIITGMFRGLKATQRVKTAGNTEIQLPWFESYHAMHRTINTIQVSFVAFKGFNGLYFGWYAYSSDWGVKFQHVDLKKDNEIAGSSILFTNTHVRTWEMVSAYIFKKSVLSPRPDKCGKRERENYATFFLKRLSLRYGTNSLFVL